MGDFLGLIVVLAVCLLSASGRKKKKQKKQKKRSPMRSSAQGEQADFGRRARDVRTEQGFTEAFEQQRMDCGTQPIHLHDADQQTMLSAGEGEDPCHEGGYSVIKPQEDDTPEAADWPRVQDDTLAQDVLRGIVMSEILTRPAERMARRRGTRRV